MRRDLDIAHSVTLQPIEAIADRAGLPRELVVPFGRDVAKISLDALSAFAGVDARRGRLVAVTAMTPTPHGEGKTVTAIGLVDGLNRVGKRAVGALRQPSLGPIFGVKGGATGGGRSQVVPRDAINLHFTGDFHAVAAAQNLLAAMTDNHFFHGNALGLDAAQISCRRALDMNDRSLRKTTLAVGGSGHSVRHHTGFDIVAACETMAVLAQARNRSDLKKRLGSMLIGLSNEGRPVTAKEIRADGAMAALLNRAIEPNLVQTLEGNPVLVHTGPFANVALGNSSVIADMIGLAHADYVVTEAGFGTDCGFEKLVDVKCRGGSYQPAAAVIVVTVRALQWHGEPGEAKPSSHARRDPETVRAGCANLAKHIENVMATGCPAVVAINQFESDTEEELAVVEAEAKRLGARVVRSQVHRLGGEGAVDLAEAVLAAVGEGSNVAPLYPLDSSIADKIATLAKRIYGADGVHFSDEAKVRIDDCERHGYGGLPICVAKTSASLSHDGKLRGRPEGFTFPIEDVRVYAGAGYVLALAGPVMTMPGLPTSPAAESIDVGDDGRVTGL